MGNVPDKISRSVSWGGGVTGASFVGSTALGTRAGGTALCCAGGATGVFFTTAGGCEVGGWATGGWAAGGVGANNWAGGGAGGAWWVAVATCAGGAAWSSLVFFGKYS